MLLASGAMYINVGIFANLLTCGVCCLCFAEAWGRAFIPGGSPSDEKTSSSRCSSRCDALRPASHSVRALRCEPSPLSACLVAWRALTWRALPGVACAGVTCTGVTCALAWLALTRRALTWRVCSLHPQVELTQPQSSARTRSLTSADGNHLYGSPAVRAHSGSRCGGEGRAR